MARGVCAELLFGFLDRESGQRQLLEAFKNGSIVIWRHLNLHGDFSSEKLQDSVGLNLSKILAVDVSP
jgi:hypothetical protein